MRRVWRVALLPPDAVSRSSVQISRNTASVDQRFDAARAQSTDAAPIGTASLTSMTGTAFTSFQKLYFDMNEAMTLGSPASASGEPASHAKRKSGCQLGLLAPALDAVLGGRLRFLTTRLSAPPTLA